MSILSIINENPESCEELRRSFERHKSSGLYVPITLPTAPAGSSSYTGAYILMNGEDTYAKGLHALIRQCNAENNRNHPTFVIPDGSRIYRPLTIRENVEARIKKYESAGTPEEKKEYFNNWLDSSCAIVYNGKSTKFKLDLQSADLMNLAEDFNKPFKKIRYQDVKHGVELDRSQTGVKYNELLTLDEILVHPAWLVVFEVKSEDDKKLLKKYAQIVITETKRDKVMGFYLLNNPAEDQLRALYVDDIGNNCSAFGNDLLNGSGRFLRRSP